MSNDLEDRKAAQAEREKEALRAATEAEKLEATVATETAREVRRVSAPALAAKEHMKEHKSPPRSLSRSPEKVYIFCFPMLCAAV